MVAPEPEPEPEPELETTTRKADPALPSSAVLWERLHAEAVEALEEEPELCLLLKRTVLAPGVSSFEEAVAMTVCYRLLQTPCKQAQLQLQLQLQPHEQQYVPPEQPVFCPNMMYDIFRRALFNPGDLELGHTMSEAVRHDVLAVLDRDPACDTILEVVLFMKGFAALVCHRAARQKWVQQLSKGNKKKRSLTAFFLQSQASAIFGVDIHPAATIGAAILLDHGTGVVIGETARVGDGCTLLHAVTLGGTGKDHGDRHPKIGARVFIGAGAKILGNLQVGDGAKIGAGSIVLKSIPAGATAVGAPAKIIGRAQEQDPARDRDETLIHVNFLHKSTSSVGTTSAATTTTTTTTSTTSTTNPPSSSDTSESHDDNDNDNDNGDDEDEDEDEDNGGKEQDAKDSNTTTEESARTKKVLHGKKHGNEVEQGGGTLPLHRHHHHHHRTLFPRPSPRLKTRSSSLYVSPDSFCPFRDYTRMAATAPVGSLTIVRLHQVLEPYGCTHDEIGFSFFELDTQNVGYVRWNVKANVPKTDEQQVQPLQQQQQQQQQQLPPLKERLATSLAHNTQLSSETIATIIETMEEQYASSSSLDGIRSRSVG